jgi:hypothetical protein
MWVFNSLTQFPPKQEITITLSSLLISRNTSMDKNENCRLHHETTKELPITTSMWGLKCENKSKGWWGALDELPWNLNTQCMGIWMMSRQING